MDLFLDSALPALASIFAIGTYAVNLFEIQAFNKVYWHQALVSLVHLLIFKEHGTLNKPDIPFIMLWSNSYGWFLYGLVAGVKPIIISNGIGLVIALYVCYVYYKFTFEKSAMLRHCMVALCYVGCLSSYIVLFQSRGETITNVGLIASLVSIGMFASPLFTLRAVIETKSAESLPAGMVIVGFICTILWTLYGIRLADVFIYAPNGIAMCLGAIQVLLLVIYRPDPKKSDDISSKV